MAVSSSRDPTLLVPVTGRPSSGRGPRGSTELKGSTDLLTRLLRLRGSSTHPSDGRSGNVPALSQYWYGILLLVVLAGGVIPRLDGFGRSIWTREAWVANSVLTDSLPQMFYYDQWLQTTPPLFLLLVRGSVGLLGLSNYSLRAIPLTFSILTLLAMAALARRVLRPTSAILCTALVALSPQAVANAKELKQYSAELAATALLLFLLWEYAEASDRRNYGLTCLGFVVFLPLSYTAVVFVPLAVVVLLICPPKEGFATRRREVLWRCSILLGVSLAVSGVDYAWFVRPNTSGLLVDFWQSGFPPRHLNGEMVRYWIEHFVSIGCSFYFPAQSSFKDAIKAAVLSMPVYIQIAAVAALVISAAALMRSLQAERRYRLAALFCVFPLLTLSVLNLLRLYPVGSRRLTLFLFPCVALFTAAVAEALWNVFIVPRLPAAGREKTLRIVAVACAAAALFLGTHAFGRDSDWTEPEDTEAALQYLKKEVRWGRDIVYIHGSIEEPVRLYLRMLRWGDSPVYFGRTGFPCCKRTVEVRPARQDEVRRYVAADVDDALRGVRAERIWLVATARSEHWKYLGVDESGIIATHLGETGWRKELERRFDNEVVEEFVQLSGPGKQ